ncbi:SRPBCC family protein [Salinisphaera sp. SPP-AMP-43]|uniref:SRPBCC family protein n=1 Tax=Salinisphaera sp. SPP-AMP-43 TaxID=3121288 RepID=UPI003C6DD56E
MNIEQRFTLDIPPEDVWQAFHDPALLVACLPGASLSEPAEDSRLKLQFQVKLGPITAAFNGEGELVLNNDQRSGQLEGRGVDRRSNSRVKGEAAFSVAPEGAGTAVDLRIAFSITGKLAQFSREGIVQALAEQLTRDFAANLQQALQPEPAAATTAESASAPARPQSESEPAQPAGEPVHTARHSRPVAARADSINTLQLVWRMLRSYFRRLFGSSGA